MAYTVTQYRDEFISSFEERSSLLRSTVTTEAVINGNTATFLVAGSGGATAVTRGVQGLIPARANDNTQVSATLVEWHDLVRMTNFDIFQAQGNQRRIMQINTMGTINRKIDYDILSALSAATNDTGAAVTGGVEVIAKAIAILGNAEVPVQDMNNMFGILSPSMYAYLMQTTEFGSQDYVDNKPFSGPIRQFIRWYGINFTTHPNVTGVGTASEESYIYHRSAIGHAVASGGIDSAIGRDEEQDYSWSRTTVYMGSKLLQNSGVVKIIHDGSAYVAS